MNSSHPTSFNFIGEKTELTGNIYIEGDTHIHGKVTGNISGDSTKTLFIEYSGQVQGNIEGLNVIIQGQLLGDIIDGQRVEATSSARVKGTIESKKLQIFPGAKIMGNIESNSKVNN